MYSYSRLERPDLLSHCMELCSFSYPCCTALKLFHFCYSCFFEMQGSELHSVFQVWSPWNMDFQCGMMTSSFSVTFLITLNTRSACSDWCQALSWYFHGPVYHTLKNLLLTGNSQLHLATALYVKLGWIFFFPACVAFLSVIGDYFLWLWKTMLWFCSERVVWPICLMGRYGWPKCWNILWKF